MMCLLACETDKGAANRLNESLAQYVEPRIGTAYCRCFHFAPETLTFGMAKPAPATLITMIEKT